MGQLKVTVNEPVQQRVMGVMSEDKVCLVSQHNISDTYVVASHIYVIACSKPSVDDCFVLVVDWTTIKTQLQQQ